MCAGKEMKGKWKRHKFNFANNFSTLKKPTDNPNS